MTKKIHHLFKQDHSLVIHITYSYMMIIIVIIDIENESNIPNE